MKTMKSAFVLFILLAGSVSFAQPPGGGQRAGQQGPPPVPNDKQIEKMVSDLSENLSLSKEQEVKILDLYKEHFAEMKEMTSGNNRPDREEMEALASAFEKKVKSVLTEEQVSRYEAYLKKQNRQGPQRR